MSMHKNNYELWAEQVNAEGGIFVKDLERKLPVKLVGYDDRSDIETAVRLYEKLMTSDKVDLVLPPWGTAMHFAVGPIANKYKYPLISTSATSMKFKEMNTPYFFHISRQPDGMNEALVDLLKYLREKGDLKKVAVLYVGDLFGIENSAAITPLLPVEGFEVADVKSYSLGTKDLSQVLKAQKAKEVDAVVAHAYPPDGMLITGQSMGIGFNPSVMYAGVVAALPFYYKQFGKATDGIMGPGSWNNKVPYKGAKEYFDAYLKKWKLPPDHWGGNLNYTSLQIIEQAIEKAGSLDREKIRNVLDTERFETIIGPVKFTNRFNTELPGMVQQWQNGIYEIIWPRDRATAEVIFPKPPWPQKEK
jgi:branched-chain amino acid transport system substrate-binding protein